MDNNDSKGIDPRKVSYKSMHIRKGVKVDISSETAQFQQMHAFAEIERKYNLVEGKTNSRVTSNEIDSSAASREFGKRKDTDENSKVFTTFGELDELNFKSCKKVVTLKVLELTQDEVNKRGGKIETLEGELSLNPGDYLACGIKGEEWPIKRENFVGYEKIAGPNDERGFTTYKPPDMKRGSVQINEPFKLRLPENHFLDGKAGDYMIRHNERVWLVDREICEKTYQVSQEAYQSDLPKKKTSE